MSGQSMNNMVRTSRLTGMACIALLSGCALGPDFSAPSAPPVTQYLVQGAPDDTVSAGDVAQHFDGGAQIAAQWWQCFQSPELERIVKQMLADNPGLQAAQASLRQSQDSLNAGYGVFFPQLDAAFSPSRQRFSPARFGSSSSGSVFNLFTATASVSYVFDVFGAERRTVESLEAQRDLQRYNAAATYLTLTGNAVNTLVALAAYQAEAQAQQQSVALLQREIALTEAQAQAGTVPYQNVLNLRNQLNALQAVLAPLQQKIDQSLHLQASLAGKTPAQWTAADIRLQQLRLPADLPLLLPSELVRQRPDILAAEAQLHSDSAKIGVATANMFPSISLSANYGYNNQSLPNLFANYGNLWSMAGNFAQPLFHGGSLWNSRKAAVEAYRHSLELYRQTVISAFQQVADILKALQHDAELQNAQQQAMQNAQQSLTLLEANYQAGLVNYQQVLAGQNLLQQSEIAYWQALAQRFQDSVALFIALGGGWQANTDSAAAQPELAGPGEKSSQ
jgi:NodT family efflux transporter outer membrane factor (OMF) lipoprotein